MHLQRQFFSTTHKSPSPTPYPQTPATSCTSPLRPPTQQLPSPPLIPLLSPPHPNIRQLTFVTYPSLTLHHLPSPAYPAPSPFFHLFSTYLPPSLFLHLPNTTHHHLSSPTSPLPNLQHFPSPTSPAPSTISLLLSPTAYPPAPPFPTFLAPTLPHLPSHHLPTTYPSTPTPPLPSA
jgi:hypothetical protein